MLVLILLPCLEIVLNHLQAEKPDMIISKTNNYSKILHLDKQCFLQCFDTVGWVF